METAAIDTAFGRICLVAEDGAICRAFWGDVRTGPPDDLLREACRQVAAYAAGELREFDLPLRVAGSDFQREVCAAMRAIPFGETRTYGEIARDLGAMPQAVGGACGGNPIPLIIPCHRVLGASGLGGFSAPGGIETKVALLRHEGAASLLI